MMLHIQSKTYFLAYFLAVSQRFISGFNFARLVSLYDHIVAWMMMVLHQQETLTYGENATDLDLPLINADNLELYKNTSTYSVAVNYYSIANGFTGGYNRLERA